MQAPRNNYTIREGSMEATTEEDGDISQDPNIRPWPGHPAPEDVNNNSSPAAEVLEAPDIRRQPQTSGASPTPGHTALPRKSGQNIPESTVTSSVSPDIRPASPDIRLPVKPRTSGPMLGHPALPACV